MNVVFVAPYAMKATLHFIRSTAKLPDVRLGVISQEPGDKIVQGLEGLPISGFERVDNAMDPEQLNQAVRAIARGMGGRVDRLVGVLEQLQEPLAEVRESLDIRGMDVQEARNFRDKAQMKDILRANSLPCALHALVKSEAQALEFAERCLPLVAKPPAGAGARNTQRIETREELEGYLRAFPPAEDDPLLLEEFIQGKEHSFDSVTVGGQPIFHSISRYTTTPLEVMEDTRLQWCVVLPRDIEGDEFADIRSAGARALKALGMFNGLTHMEWFRRADGSIAISEVAARPPGAQFTTLLSYAHDYDFYDAWARLMVFENFAPPKRTWSVGALFLRAQSQEVGDEGSESDGTLIPKVRAIHGIEVARKELGSLVVEAKIPEPGTPHADTYEGEGYVILRDKDTNTVEAGLRRLNELVRIESA